MITDTTYLPPQLEHLGEFAGEEDLLDEVPSEFKTGRDEDDQQLRLDPFPKYVCKFCGADTFQVGHRDYSTRIRCTTCAWETRVHSG